MTLIQVVKSLHGWCEPEKAQRIYDLIKEKKSSLTIELGVFGGRSFIPMALAHRDMNHGFVIGIDAWKASASLEGENSPANDEYWKKVDYRGVYKSCQEAISTHLLEDYCDTLRLKSQHAALFFADNIVDVLHQDSGHNFSVITKELELWSPKLKMGAYWIIDDCNWVESLKGYAKLPDYGFELVEDHTTWQIHKKVK